MTCECGNPSILKNISICRECLDRKEREGKAYYARLAKIKFEEEVKKIEAKEKALLENDKREEWENDELDLRTEEEIEEDQENQYSYRNQYYLIK